jgi:uncharacterized cupredoxin-like copper-binding protein
MIRTARVLSAVALVMVIAACGGDSSSGGSGRTVEISLNDDGCSPFELTLPAGSTSFHVKNDGADSITEFEVLDSGNKVVAEKENLTPGLEGRFTVDLQPGTYVLACPGGKTHPTGTLTVTGASSDSSTGAAGSGTASSCIPSGTNDTPTGHVRVGLADFTMQVDPDSVPAGAIALDGTNTGTHPHEIVIVKGVAPAALPTDAQGSVDEKSLPAGAEIGEVEAFNPGLSCSGTFALDAGTYTLFCNVVGEEGAHFKLGMVTTLTVS